VPVIQPVAPGQGNLIPVTGTYVQEHLEALLENGVPVFRVLRSPEGTLRSESADPKSVLTLPESEKSKKLFLVERQWTTRVFAQTDTFDAQLEPLLTQSAEDRSRAVTALKTTLADLKNSGAPPEAKAQAIMDNVSQAFLLNKASLKTRPQDVTVHERTLAKDTEAIVGTALEMAEDPALMGELLSCFRGLSNGQTVNHVLRVFVSFTGFLGYYNTLHQNRLSALLRPAFAGAYLERYRALLPGVSAGLMTSDQLLQLPAVGFFERKEYALGAFLHDIGKMGNIDYFESEAAYDPAQIQQHAFLGAGLILMNYGNAHDGARLLAGDHHNALGHAGGYGITRLERERGVRKPRETVKVLSGDSEGFVTGEALGWLPVEMLAVADVYDAMTDTSRSYKKAMTSAQAAVFLEDTMAAGGKLDPVLVDLYIDFLRTQGVEVPDDRGLRHRIRAK
jgi:hypothetical protein